MRLRPATAHDLHGGLGRLALRWTPALRPATAGAYIVRHGVGHLSVHGDLGGVEELLCRLDYLGAMVDAFRGRLERPLACARLAGWETLRVRWTEMLTDPLASQALRWHVWALLGDFWTQTTSPHLAERAYACAREALDTEGVTDRALASIEARLGKCMLENARPDEARPHLQHAFELRLAFYGPDDELTLRARHGLASCDLAIGRFDVAEAGFREVHAGQVRLLGEAHLDTLVTLGDLALTLHKAGRHAEAEPLARAAVEWLGLHAPSDCATLRATNTLASCLQDLERWEEATQVYEVLRDDYLRRWGLANADTMIVLNNLATLYGQCGREEDASVALAQAVEAGALVLPPHHSLLLRLRSNLGHMHAAAGRTAEAVDAWTRAWHDGLERAPLQTVLRLRVAASLCDGAIKLGERTATVRYRDAFLASWDSTAPTADTLVAANNLASALLASGDPSGAAVLYGRCRAGWSPGDWRYLWARLGGDLCAFALGGGEAAAQATIVELSVLLGNDHDQVVSARQRLMEATSSRVS